MGMSLLGFLFCWVPVFPGLCMVSLLGCLIPFGRDNMCGQQGDNASKEALIVLIILSILICINFAIYLYAKDQAGKGTEESTKVVAAVAACINFAIYLYAQ